MKISAKHLQDIIEEETKIVLNKKLKEEDADPTKDPALPENWRDINLSPTDTSANATKVRAAQNAYYGKRFTPAGRPELVGGAGKARGEAAVGALLKQNPNASQEEKDRVFNTGVYQQVAVDAAGSESPKLSSPGELSLDMPTLPAPSSGSVAKKGSAKGKARKGGSGGFNSQDAQVTHDIQELLKIKTDGIYGPETTRAVKQYFASRGEPVPTGPTFSAAIAAQLEAIRRGGGKSNTGSNDGSSGGGEGGGAAQDPSQGWSSINKMQLAQITDEVIDDLDFPATVEGIQKATTKVSALARKAVPNQDGTKFYPAIFLFLRDYEENQNFGESFDDVIAYLKGDSTLLRDISKIGGAMGIGDEDPQGEGLGGHMADTAIAAGTVGGASRLIPTSSKLNIARRGIARAGGKMGYELAARTAARAAAGAGAKRVAGKMAGKALASVLGGPVGWAVGAGSLANDLFGNKIGAMIRGGTGKVAVETLESVVNQLKSEGNQWITNNAKFVDEEMQSKLGNYAADALASDVKVPNEQPVPNEKTASSNTSTETELKPQSELKPGDAGYGVMKEGNVIKINKSYFEQIIKEELRSVLKI